MIILDTDHLTVLKYAKDSRFMKLAQRMADSVDQDFATTAITLAGVFGFLLFMVLIGVLQLILKGGGHG